MSPATNAPLIGPAVEWAKRPVNYNFPIEFPIFWGPNQLTSWPSLYTSPLGFTDRLPLAIPRVFRGFYGGNNNTPVPPVPPVPPAQNSLCHTGSGKGFILIGYRFFRAVNYRVGLWSPPQCDTASLYFYNYLYPLQADDSGGSYTVNGVSGNSTSHLSSREKMEGHSKANFQGLTGKHWYGESGRTTVSNICFQTGMRYERSDPTLVVDSGSDLGPGTAEYTSEASTPWTSNPKLQLEQKYTVDFGNGNDGKGTVYFFVSCISDANTQVGICSAVLPGWNTTPGPGQITEGCGRDTPRF